MNQRGQTKPKEQLETTTLPELPPEVQLSEKVTDKELIKINQILKALNVGVGSFESQVRVMAYVLARLGITQMPRVDGKH